MQDEEIVELYWQRSDRAIPESERKYGRYCHSIAYRICQSNEDAEECVNDTWFKAWNAMPDARPSVLSAFLGAITAVCVYAVYLVATYLLSKSIVRSSVLQGKAA